MKTKEWDHLIESNISFMNSIFYHLTKWVLTVVKLSRCININQPNLSHFNNRDVVKWFATIMTSRRIGGSLWDSPLGGNLYKNPTSYLATLPTKTTARTRQLNLCFGESQLSTFAVPEDSRLSCKQSFPLCCERKIDSLAFWPLNLNIVLFISDR